MKLVGIGVHSPALAEQQWIPLDDLTVVVGANDAGKSTTLTTVHNALALLHGTSKASTWDVQAGIFDLTLDLGAELFERLLARTCQSVAEGEAAVRFELGGRPVYLNPDAGPPHGRRIKNFLPSADDPRRTWLTFVRVQADLELRRWDPFFEALSGSSTVEMRPVESMWQEGEMAWQVSWCLPPVRELSEEVRQLCGELGIDLEAVPQAPRGIVPAIIGTVDDAGLPMPFWVPRPVEQLGEETTRAATLLGRGLLDAFACASEYQEELELDRPFVQPSQAELHARSMAVLAALARAQLPDFVAGRYDLIAATDEPTIELQLVSRRSGRRFGLQHLAEGHRLWVQLAIIDALGVVDRSAGGLSVGLGLDGARLDDTILSLLRIVAEDWDEGSAELAGVDLEHLAAMWAGAQVFEREVSRDTLAIPGAEPARIYVIDEPERHLHPALQRQAARWLRDWCRRRSVQCLVATHAPAFMALAEDVQHLRVWRREDELVEIGAIDPGAMTATSELAIELGLDRGELLGLHRMVLFVEGATDAAALEALMPERLREIGVLICPMHGVAGVRAIPDAQVLFHVLRVPFAVLVDNDPAAEVRGLLERSTEELRALSGSRRHSEIVHVARMLAAARSAGVHVEPFSIRSKDILGLLAAEAVTDAVALHGFESEAAWPGIDAAMAEYDVSERGEKLDVFLRRRFGVRKDPALFTTAGRETRRRGLVPQEAFEFADDLERLSLSIV